jgi:HK97 family phage portal protein
MIIVDKFFTSMRAGVSGLALGWKGVLPRGMEEWIQLLNGGYKNSAGEVVNSRTALQVSAFYACVRVIAEDMAKIGLKFYHRDQGESDSTVDEAPLHPLNTIFNEAANGWQSGFDFREMQSAFLCLRGAAYALKVRSLAKGELSDGQGQIVELVPITPDRVSVEQLRGGKLKFHIQPPTNDPSNTREYSENEIYYERGLTLNGYTGVSPIQYQAETLGFALAQTKYGSRMMGNGGKPGGLLVHPAKLRDDARKRLKESWDAAYGGDNQGKTAVLEEGMTWQTTSLKNTDLQYIEVMKMSRQQVAAIMRVPLHKIGDLENAHYNNIEHGNIQYVTDCLMGWAKRRESAIRRQLIDQPQFYYAEHNLDTLLRGDLKTRYDAYAVARNWGWLSADDIRKRENLNPLPAGTGDVYLQPLNMAPAGTDVTKLEKPAKEQLKALAKELGKEQELNKLLAGL